MMNNRESPPKQLQQTYHIRFSDCDLNSRWKLSSVLQAAQDISGAHSDILGCGNDVLQQKNIAWILARQRYRFTRYPHQGEDIIITTWPGLTRFTMFPRYLTFSSADGTPLGAGYAIWFLLQRNTGQLLKPEAAQVFLPETAEYPAPVPAPERIKPPESPAEIFSRQVCYSDADFNGHLNNARYMEWICDLCAPERFCTEYPADITINYLHEAKLGQTVTMHKTEQNDMTYVFGKNAQSEQELFAAKLVWEKTV